jgi:uncharacterized beta-barrel protein YwiB (DUF1934 family)
MKVKITTETRQTVNGETESLTHTATGILREQARDRHSLTYLLDGIHHEMFIDLPEHEIRVIRNWDEKNVLVYHENVHHVMDYQTPVGGMQLGFNTKYLEIDRIHSDAVLSILIVYQVTQFGNPVSDNEVRIKLTEMS